MADIVVDLLQDSGAKGRANGVVDDVMTPSVREPRTGRYWNIRKAMPREFLDALESQQGVDPRTIKLDFQLKKHGLASWYARTYDGSLWRVWRPNRNADLGVQTEPVPDDLQAS